MKKFLIGIVAVFTLIIIALVVAISMVNLNKYKPQIEKAVKDSSGYEMKINGDISTSFSPLGVSISKVSIKNPQIKSSQKFFDMDKLSVAVELKPLLNKEVKVKYIVLNNLNLNIKKLLNGKFNFEVINKKSKTSKAKKEKKSGETKLPMVNINEVRIKNANINYEDLKTKSKANVQNINVSVNNIGFDPSKKIIKAISFDADTKISQVLYDKFKIKDISVALNMKNGIATLTNMKLTTFDSLATAKGRLNLNKKIPVLDIEVNIPKFKLENFSREYLKKDILNGIVKVHKKFRLSLGDQKTITRTLTGGFVIDGKGVGIKGFDLDKILSKYNNAKKTNPLDLGMSLASGFAKGGNLSGIFGSQGGGTTLLKRLYIKVNIAKHIANLTDVAMATGKNRIAFKGKLDILNKRFLNMKFGVLDSKGCARFSQTIQGTFNKPKIKMDASSIESAVNVATSLLNSFGVKTPKMPTKKKGKCKVFYSGVVK